MGSLTSLFARLAIVGALFLALAGPAAAAPCWKSVVLDWSADGSVDKTYPLACYHQAIAHLQPDLKLYSSASDDIRRALQNVVTTNNETATTAAVTTTPAPTTPEPTPTTAPTPTAETPTTPEPAPVTTEQTTTEQAPVEQQPKPKPKPVAVAVVATDSGSSVPLPLLVLGGIAILLVAAGVAGMIWRRSHGDPPGTA